MYWHHLAYATGGIAEIKQLWQTKQLPTELYDAWRLIDSGKIDEGSNLLTRYEQEVSAQEVAHDPNPDEMRFLGLLVPTPVGYPGDASSFLLWSSRNKNAPHFEKFENRWKWIEGAVLPQWQKTVKDYPMWVQQQMNKFVKLGS